MLLWRYKWYKADFCLNEKMYFYFGWCPTQELLSGSNPSLTDVLEEDSVVQEAKVSNPKLVAYLQQAEVVQELVRMIVDARAGDGESHASTACELLCCDVDGMLTTLLSHKQGELFYTLLSFLSKCESESCLDERMAGRFTHAVSSVFARRSGEVVELLRYVSDLVGMFMRTLGNASVTDLLTRLVCADECIALDVEDARHVFASKGLAAELKDRLSSNCNEHVRMNASEVLCAITRSTHSPLSRELATEPIISSLASLALPCSDPTQGSLQALEVLVAQLDPQQSSAGPTLTMQSPYEGNLFGNDDDDVEDPFRPFREVVIETASRAPELEYVLRTAPSEVEVANSSAAAQPVGPRRLKVAEGVASLIKAREPSAAEKLQQAGVMSALIDLSFSCPYNSMAHHALERAVCSALDWEASDLAHHVVFDCKLPHRLASVQRFWQMANGRRARSGFMGHIVRMSDKLEDVLGDELLSNDEWQAFADGELSDVRDASNTSAWDCGRPPGVDDMLMEAFNQVNTTDNAHGYSLPSYAAAGFAPLGEVRVLKLATLLSTLCTSSFCLPLHLISPWKSCVSSAALHAYV